MDTAISKRIKAQLQKMYFRGMKLNRVNAKVGKESIHLLGMTEHLHATVCVFGSQVMIQFPFSAGVRQFHLLLLGPSCPEKHVE
jgi:hypothetical protein